MRSKDAARPKPPRSQLQMVYPLSQRRRPAVPSLPRGYTLRTYRPGDETGYARVMRLAGFKDWKKKEAHDTAHTCLPGGLFLVADKTGRIVATAVAQHSPHRDHPNGAQLGWVAADPAHKGKRLGQTVSAAATQRLIDAGYTDVFLLTDDWRLPAIGTYLRLGYRPYLTKRGMKERWLSVCKKLGVDYSKVGALRRR